MLLQHDVEHANVAMLDDPLSLSKAMRLEDASKWEAPMLEEYGLLMSNRT